MVDFVLEVVRNYKGAASKFLVLREIVARFPDDDQKIKRVKLAIADTGVVGGELGFAEAYKSEKQFLEEWLTDDRPEVKAFAQQGIKDAEQMIAGEYRRVETAREMRRRN